MRAYGGRRAFRGRLCDCDGGLLAERGGALSDRQMLPAQRSCARLHSSFEVAGGARVGDGAVDWQRQRAVGARLGAGQG